MTDDTESSKKTKEERSSQDEEAKVSPIRVGDQRGRGKKHLLSGTCE
ncbi:MAG: hypothetical protein Q7J10_02850 [Methanosarcinaceae archaeon]|nr:hypothetical protein [Methanosarcinaceae archaeon]